jgi:hypothetical protein
MGPGHHHLQFLPDTHEVFIMSSTISATIGNTPLLKLEKLSQQTSTTLLAAPWKG